MRVRTVLRNLLTTIIGALLPLFLAAPALAEPPLRRTLSLI